MDKEPAFLNATGLGHRYGDGDFLFERVSFSLKSGEVVALTGPSGSGKSTLLSILAGWVEPSAGAIETLSVRSIRWVLQNPYGQPQRLTRDHVSFPFLTRGYRRREAELLAEELLERFGLAGRGVRLFADLSGGEAQRLMLARAVASEPDLLLVDEPTAQLDRASANTVNSVLSELSDRGAIVVVASHDNQTIEACQRSIHLGSLS